MAESNLTRCVRTLVQMLNAQVLDNTSITVSVDYDDTTDDGLDIIAISELPSLVLSGPRLRENKFLSTNEHHQELRGEDIVTLGPVFTMDLYFGITAASNRTVELLDMMAALTTFFTYNRWIEMPRDPDAPAAGTVRWEMDPDGEIRTRLDGAGDVRAFTWGLIIRGFDIGEHQVLNVSRPVDQMVTEINKKG